MYEDVLHIVILYDDVLHIVILYEDILYIVKEILKGFIRFHYYRLEKGLKDSSKEYLNNKKSQLCLGDQHPF